MKTANHDENELNSDSDWRVLLHEAVTADEDDHFLPPEPETLPSKEFALIHNCLRQLEQLRRERLNPTLGFDNTHPSLDVDAPRRIGRFEILRELGRGGHGVVFLAFDPALRRQVALKVPRPEVLASPEMRRRFIREAHAAGRLKHPNIIDVYDIGDSGPICYITSDYCSGGTLAHYLRLTGAGVAPNLAAGVIAEVADGVQYAHDHGVLHRDIKPSNVLLTPRAGLSSESGASANEALGFAAVLTDFGLARVDEVTGDQTMSGTLLGTPAYMAPEQAKGRLKEISPATDVYGLGVVLYEMLAGRPPFRGVTDADTLRQVLFEEPPQLRRLRPDLPADLEAICRCCLEHDPRQRYSSARELAADLRCYLRGEPTLVRPLAPIEKLIRWTRRKPAVAALVAVSSFGLLTLLGVLAWSNLELSKAYKQVVEKEKAAEASALEARERSYVSDMRLLGDTWTRINNQQANALLDLHRPKSGEPDLRGFEWWLYSKMINTDSPSRVVGKHEGSVNSIVLSPLKDTVATGGKDGRILLWNAKEGSLVRQLLGHTGELNELAFSPDGKRLASACDDKTVRIWDVTTGTTTQVCSGHTAWVAAVVFLPDGETIASGGADTTIVLWDANTGEERGRLLGHRDTVRSIAYHSPTDCLLSVSEDKTIRAWDLKTNKPSDLLPSEGFGKPNYREGHEERWFRKIIVEPDQRRLIGISFGSTLVQWDLGPEIFGKFIQTHEFDSMIRSESMDGAPGNMSVALGMEDGQILVLNGNTFENNRRPLRGHITAIDALAISAEAGVLWSGSADGEIRQWSLDDSSKVVRHLRRPLAGNTHAISPDGKHLAIHSSDKAVEVIRFEDSRTIHRFPSLPHRFDAITFLPDNISLAVVSNKRELRVLMVGGESWQLSLGGDSGPNQATISRDGQLIAVAGKSEVALVNTHSRKVTHRLPHPDRANDGVFYGSEELISSGSDGAIRIWNRNSGNLVRTLDPKAGELHDIELSSDEKRLAVRGPRRVVILDLETEKVIASIPQQGDIGTMEFLAGDRTLLAWNERAGNQLWNTETWQPIGTLAFGELTGWFAVAADGNRVTFVDHDGLVLFDATPIAESSRK